MSADSVTCARPWLSLPFYLRSALSAASMAGMCCLGTGIALCWRSGSSLWGWERVMVNGHRGCLMASEQASQKEGSLPQRVIR
ncbi:MAG: hypothetical protein KAY06_06475 [Aeromonadaceae bacterium]|nr:hypothetical protein [Aeromonadaceae bacterium]